MVICNVIQVLPCELKHTLNNFSMWNGGVYFRGIRQSHQMVGGSNAHTRGGTQYRSFTNDDVLRQRCILSRQPDVVLQGSHLVDVVNYINWMWNELGTVTSKVLPELLDGKIGESLGLVLSRHVEAYDEIVENRPLALIPTHQSAQGPQHVDERSRKGKEG